MLCDHDVVQHRNPEQRAGPRQADRDLPVLPAGRRVAARVVVHQQDRGRRLAQRGPEHLARVHQARREGALGGHHLPADPVAAVQQQHQEALAGRVAEPGVEVTVHVRGTPDRVAHLQAPRGQAAAQLERGLQGGRLRRADARGPAKLAAGGARQPRQTFVPLQELGGQPRHRPARAAGAKQQGQQLRIGQRLGAELLEALARTGHHRRATSGGRGSGHRGPSPGPAG